MQGCEWPNEWKNHTAQPIIPVVVKKEAIFTSKPAPAKQEYAEEGRTTNALTVQQITVSPLAHPARAQILGVGSLTIHLYKYLVPEAFLKTPASSYQCRICKKSMKSM
jgi:hypothetical protein